MILLSTLPGERIFHPDYGCNLNQFIFEPVTYQLVNRLQREILKSIDRWEKRIEAVEIDVLSAENRDTSLRISISYTIKATGEITALIYPLNLLEMDSTGV